MADCTCTKTIGDDLAKGQVPKAFAEALAGSGLYKLTETSIQYLGGVGTVAKTELGSYVAADFCSQHAPKKEAPKKSAPTEGDE